MPSRGFVGSILRAWLLPADERFSLVGFSLGFPDGLGPLISIQPERQTHCPDPTWGAEFRATQCTNDDEGEGIPQPAPRALLL